jgi:hypothetical protein
MPGIWVSPATSGHLVTAGLESRCIRCGIGMKVSGPAINQAADRPVGIPDPGRHQVQGAGKQLGDGQVRSRMARWEFASGWPGQCPGAAFRGNGCVVILAA